VLSFPSAFSWSLLSLNSFLSVVKIRALVVFQTKLDRQRTERYTHELLHSAEQTIEVWTKRLSLPPTPKGISLDRLAEFEVDSRISYALVHISDKDSRIRDLSGFLRSTRSSFASVLLRTPDRIREISKLVESLEPEIATRFSILLNEDFLATPYYPAGSANVSEDSLALSLRYVKEFAEGKGAEALREADEVGRKLSLSLGLYYLGIDPSLSPWMEESVGKLIEDRSSKIFSFGNLNAISSINREILTSVAKAGVRGIGFSELMLPVAEDSVLTERVGEGVLTLRDLLLYSSVCVAGLDMVAVNLTGSNLEALLRDAFAVYLTKGRPYGVRLIVFPGSQALDRVEIKGFGATYVVKPF